MCYKLTIWTSSWEPCHMATGCLLSIQTLCHRGPLMAPQSCWRPGLSMHLPLSLSLSCRAPGSAVFGIVFFHVVGREPANLETEENPMRKICLLRPSPQQAGPLLPWGLHTCCYSTVHGQGWPSAQVSPCQYSLLVTLLSIASPTHSTHI